MFIIVSTRGRLAIKSMKLKGIFFMGLKKIPKKLYSFLLINNLAQRGRQLTAIYFNNYKYMVPRTLYNDDNIDNDVRDYDDDDDHDNTMIMTTLYMVVIYQGIYNKYGHYCLLLHIIKVM